jgi:RNA polymerase sigma-70 factor (sigma-E family)
MNAASVGCDVGGEPPDLAFELLYCSQRDRLVRLAYLLTGSQVVAEDLVQDTFIRIQPRLEGLADPGPYLRRSVVNACYSWHRRQRRERAVFVDPPAAVAPSEHVEMWDALSQLPTPRRTVLVLRYYLDMPEAEVAEILGWRLGTVKSATHRALRDLRRILE